MLQVLLILFAAGAAGGLTVGRRIAMGEIRMMRMMAKTGVRRRNKVWDKVKADFKRKEWKENRRWDEVKERLGENLFWEKTKGVQKTHIDEARAKVKEAQIKMRDFKQYDAAKRKVKTWRVEIDNKEKARREKWQKIKDDVKERQKYKVSADYLLGVAEEGKPQEPHTKTVNPVSK